MNFIFAFTLSLCLFQITLTGQSHILVILKKLTAALKDFIYIKCTTSCLYVSQCKGCLTLYISQLGPSTTP